MIEPHYSKTSKKRGRPPYPLATMLRIHLLEQWYSLSDPAMDEALIEVPTMRRFAGIDLITDRIPDETTILTFRHLLFESVNQALRDQGALLQEGTPSSTKNKKGERDPEMHSVAKENQWFFGMRCHIGVDAASGLIHAVGSTAANVHELNTAAERLHGEEMVVYGDSGHIGIEKRKEFEKSQCQFRIAMKPGQRRILPNTPDGRLLDPVETAKAHLRAKIEHPFRMIKRQFGFQKVCYRGIKKNDHELKMLFALANLYRARERMTVPA